MAIDNPELRNDLLSYAGHQPGIGNQTAEDLAQETLLVAANGLPTEIRTDEHQRRYLFGVLRYKIIDHYNRPPPGNSIQLDELPAPAVVNPVGGNLLRWLKECLPEINSRDAAIFGAVVLNGMPHHEVAACLEIERNAVDQSLSRARLAIQRISLEFVQSSKAKALGGLPDLCAAAFRLHSMGRSWQQIAHKLDVDVREAKELCEKATKHVLSILRDAFLDDS